MHPLHPWVTQRKAERDGVAQQKLILPERTSETYALVESYFQRDGVRIEPFIEIENEEAIKQFVQLNLGISLLPRWIAVEEELRGNALRWWRSRSAAESCAANGASCTLGGTGWRIRRASLSICAGVLRAR